MKTKISLLLIITILTILLLFPVNLRSSSLDGRVNVNTRGISRPQNIRNGFLSVEIVDHDPITINNNSDLIKQAKEEGWIGNGSLSHPYLIDGLKISGSGDLITVKNTDLYFQIIDCFISNGNGDGIVLINITNGAIVNNTISSNARHGISLYEHTGRNNLRNISVVNNSIFRNNKNGIFIDVVFVKICHIAITNNTIYSNGNNGIYMHADDEHYPITHCFIANNNISSNTKHGIILEAFCHNNIISKNTISKNSETGIYLDDYNHNNNITSNIVFQNNIGIDLDESFNCTIKNNFVTQGIFLWESDHGNDVGLYIKTGQSMVSNNTVSGGITITHRFRDKTIQYIDHITNNEVYGGGGISLFSTQHGIIANNTIYNVTGVGIYGTTNHSTFSSNFVYNCRDEGIYLDKSINNTIINNTFYNNNLFGLRLLRTSRSRIHWNDFIGNSRAGKAQAQDDYLSGDVTNNFTLNFWYDWREPNNNSDLLMDTPYMIDVYLTKDTPNQDPFPLSHPNKPFHFLTRPRIFFPIEDDPTHPGSVTLQWVQAIDFLNHTVEYTVYYSTNQGSLWTCIVSNWSNNSYTWTPPVSNFGSNRELVFKVVAYCSDGLTAEDITDNSYLITYTNTPSNSVYSWSYLLLLPSIIMLIVFKRSKR